MPNELAEMERRLAYVLTFVGLDLTDPGLKDTPRRVLMAWLELTECHSDNAAAILGTSFECEDYDQMVIVKGIPFVSICEHHMMPFVGHVSVGYLPNNVTKTVVGLSKIPRLVESFARRPQIKERMTQQIAQTIHDGLDALGVGVVVSGVHACMTLRGARSDGEMITSSLTGRFKRSDVKAEFHRLIAM